MFTPVPFISTGVSRLDYVTHVTDSTFPMTLMNGIEPGDLLVFLERNRDNSPPIASTAYPSGWTAIGTGFFDSTNNTKLCASYKIAVGNEDGTSITGMAEDQFWDGIVIQYRANKRIVSCSKGTPVSYAGSSEPPPQTITASSGVPPVLAIVNYYTYDQNVNGRTMSTTYDHEVSSGSTWYLRDKIQNLAPQNFTFDMSDSGSDNILFGFYLHNFNRAPLPLTTLSYVGANSDSSDYGIDYVVAPDNILPGDLLVHWDTAHRDGTYPTDTTPSGFTKIRTQTFYNSPDGMYIRQTLSYKIATGSEAGAEIHGILDVEQSPHWVDKIIAVFRGNAEISNVSVVPSGANYQITSGDPTAQSVSISGQTQPLVVIGVAETDSSPTFTFTPGYDGEVNAPGNNCKLRYKIYNISPQNCTIDVNDTGNWNGLMSCALVCSSAS